MSEMNFHNTKEEKKYPSPPITWKHTKSCTLFQYHLKCLIMDISKGTQRCWAEPKSSRWVCLKFPIDSQVWEIFFLCICGGETSIAQKLHFRYFSRLCSSYFLLEYLVLCLENIFPALFFPDFSILPSKSKGNWNCQGSVIPNKKIILTMSVNSFQEGRIWFYSDHEKLLRAWQNAGETPAVLMGALLNVISSSNREA